MATADQPPAFTKTNVPNLWRYEPSGSYYLFARIGGKLKKKSLGTNVFSIAKLRLADRLKAEHQGLELRGRTSTGKLTVRQAGEQLLARLEGNGGKARTPQFYRERMSALFKHSPGLAEKECARLTVTDCQAWADRYRALVGPATFNGTLLVFRRIVGLAVEQGLRFDNPVKVLKRLKLAPRRPVLPSQEKFKELLAHVDAVPFGRVPRCATLIRFLAFSGARISEARRVQWAHVHFEKKAITIHGDPVTGTKNWEIRDIPMIPEMERLLLGERAKRPSETADALVIQVKECNGTLASACQSVGIPKLTHHDLRDLFATRCIEQDVDIPTVASWLGHKDGGALLMKIYAHLRPEHSALMGAKVSFGTT